MLLRFETSLALPREVFDWIGMGSDSGPRMVDPFQGPTTKSCRGPIFFSKGERNLLMDQE